jgi:hypothetical protein
VETGYDLARVRALGHRTAEAIERLRSIRSDDPAAADAMRTVELARRNLEDFWMPAIREIEYSDAMVSWVDARLDLVVPTVAGAPDGDRRCDWTTLSPLTDEQLIGRLRWADRVGAGLDLDTLARETAARVGHDRSFGERLVELAPTTPLIASLAARANFPASFLQGLVTAMMWPQGPRATADLDGFASALSSALAALVDDAGACLDLLLDPAILFGLADWERLDPDVVTEFTLSALHGAVVEDPARLGDGYRVLGALTAITNGPLDDGIQPGLALGVAASMAGYIETLAPAIRLEDSYPVVVIDQRRGIEVELGTYDDLVDLFGALLRDRSAQAALGAVLGAYTTNVVTGLGGDIAVRPGLEYVTRFADLVGDASRAEQVELVVAAAAEEVRRRQLGAVIGFGLTATLAVGGAGPLARSFTSRAVALATEFAGHVGVDVIPDGQIPALTYDLITVVALRVVTTDPIERHRAGLSSVSSSAWTEIADRLERIDAAGDRADRTRHVLRLDRWIEAEVPLLAGYLNRIRSVPGMDELSEGRSAVRAD